MAEEPVPIVQNVAISLIGKTPTLKAKVLVTFTKSSAKHWPLLKDFFSSSQNTWVSLPMRLAQS